MRSSNDKLTSITVSAAAKFAKTAEQDAQLGCTRIHGLYLRKTAKSATWYLRYTDAMGKRAKLRLGRLLVGEGLGGHIQTIAKQALEYQAMIARGDDPLQQIQQKKEKQREVQQSQVRNRFRRIGTFFEQIYRPHKLRSRYGPGTCKIIEANFSHLFDRDMDTLTAHDIREWEHKRYQEKREQGKSLKRETLVRDLGAFKAMLNFAAGQKKDDPIDEPVIDNNPIANVTVRKASAEERDQQFLSNDSSRRMLTEDELKKLVTGLNAYAEQLRSQRRSSRKHGKKHLPDLDQVSYPHWFVPFTWIALYTGFRPGDIYGLRWEPNQGNSVNLNFGVINIVPEKTRDKGQQPVSIKHPMSEELKQVIKAWHDQQGKPASGYVFPNGAGDRLAKKSHDKHWRHVKRLGGLDDSLAFYSLRHHFISSLVVNKVPLLHIAKLVGHKSTHMIEQNYGHLLPDTAKSVISQFSQSISSLSTPHTESEKVAK